MPGQTFGQALGKLIVRKRKSMGLTQTQLAEDAYGTTTKTRRISELENGTVANPHPKTIDPIISVLRISEAELEKCAAESHSLRDEGLDRAYREARNLIDAIARQFEHSNPAASLSELDDFLRAKAKEWASLRDRITSLEADDASIKALTEAASEALAEGHLDEVETLLSRLEDSYQYDRTFVELRKLAGLRIAKADLSLLKRDYARAANFYLSAAELFSGISESEMVELLEFNAWRVYESGRQSIEPYFQVATPLLERAASTDLVKKSRIRLAETQYHLSMILRNAVERDETSDHTSLLRRAIDHCRLAPSFDEITDNIEHRSKIIVSLCNCISNLYELEENDILLNEGIATANLLLIDSRASGKAREFLPYVCNALGVLLIKQINGKDGEHRGRLIDNTIDVFRESISSSEKEAFLYPWASAKVNLANLFIERSHLFERDTEESKFSRVLAISEFQSSLDSFTILNLPTEYAQAHTNLGRALVEHATADFKGNLTELYLARAIASYEISANTFTEDRFPEKWASITLQMARVFAIHSQIEGIESVTYDLEQSRAHFEKSLKFYRTRGPSEMVDYCLESLGKIEEQSKHNST